MKFKQKYFSSFSRIQPDIKPVDLVGFDTEDDTKGTPVSVAFYGKDGPFYTTSMDEGIDYIYGTPNPTVFVAHNLEYDLGNLFKHCDWKYLEDMLYANQLLRCGLVASKHYFINSASFFHGPLSKMGKTIGVPKLEGDVTNPKYVIRDAEIVYRFMSMFQKDLNDAMQVNLGITIGQMAMAAYRRNYMSRQEQITYNSPNILKAYYGGRVEIFYKGAIEDIKVSDINSSYPNVMRNFPYPDTELMEESRLDTHEFGVGKFEVNVPDSVFIPPLPVKSQSKRLFFPRGTFKGWWTYAEIRYAQSLGCTVLNEFYGEGSNVSVRPFVEFISDAYEKRLQAKANNDSFRNLFWKLFPNNLYGKFCQHRGGSSISREMYSVSQMERRRVKAQKMIGQFYCYTSAREDPPSTANFLWGVYVTAYARLELHRAMQKIHDSGGTLIYCDTDSIMYSGLDKSPLEIGNQLGQWDEEKFDLGVFRQAKGYLLCNKVKDKRTKLNVFDIEKVACKGVNTDYAYDFIVRGMATFLKPMRFKESLIRLNADVNADKGSEFEKEIGANVWREVTKTMQSVYIKRVGESGVTFPVDYKDIAEMEAGTDITSLSIEDDLRKQKIKIRRKRIIRKFGNIKIPASWFKRNEPRKHESITYASQRLKWLKSSDCLGLKQGETWFSGHVFAVEQGRFGKYYRILLTNFKNQETPKGIWAAMSLKFLRAIGTDENLTGLILDISMRKVYFEKKPLILDVRFHTSDLCARSEDEITDIETLSEEQTQQLQGADWSFLNELTEKINQ